MDARTIGAGLMAYPCPIPISGSGFVSTALAHFDCQAQSIGEAGYRAMAMPNSAAFLILTALLTLYIAILGFRMLGGQQLSMNDFTVAAIKIGIVLTLATSWSTYRIFAYDIVLHGADEITATIGPASGIANANMMTGIAERSQSVDNAISNLIALGTGRNDLINQSRKDVRSRMAPPLLNDDLALGLGRTVFVTSLLASNGFLRLFGGLILALAPLFSGLLLFDATRGLFWGWVRSLIAVWSGSIAVSIIFGVELTILEPWLSRLLELRATHQLVLEAPFELLTLALTFTFILLGSLLAILWLCYSSGMVHWVKHQLTNASSAHFDTSAQRPNIALGNENEPMPSRAFMIARSLSASQQQHTANRIPHNLMHNPDAQNQNSQNSYPVDTIPSLNTLNNHAPLGASYRRTARRTPASSIKRSSPS